MPACYLDQVLGGGNSYIVQLHCSLRGIFLEVWRVSQCSLRKNKFHVNWTTRFKVIGPSCPILFVVGRGCHAVSKAKDSQRQKRKQSYQLWQRCYEPIGKGGDRYHNEWISVFWFGYTLQIPMWYFPPWCVYVYLCVSDISQGTSLLPIMPPYWI